MGKYRLVYGAALLAVLILLFCFSKGYLLALLAVLILLPVVSGLLLRRDARHIELECEARAACQTGQSLGIALRAEGRRPILAAGSMELTLSCKNYLFGEETTQYLTLPLDWAPHGVDYSPALCGMVQVSVQRAVCRDLFGLCGASLKLPGAKVAVVHPEHIPLRVTVERPPQGYAVGDRYYQNRRGSDPSEVSDLREYQPGDDVRSMHWKLSSKLGNLILRQASEPSYSTTAVLFDAGLGDGETDLLRSAVEVGVTVSQQLIRQGEPHDMLLMTSAGLRRAEVRNSADQLAMVDQWMGLRLQEEAQGGWLEFELERMDRVYSKLIYITAGRVPEGLRGLGERMDVTALCLSMEPDAHIGTAEQGGLQILTLPADRLRSAEYHITV